MDDRVANSRGFEPDVISDPGADAPRDDLHRIITAIARASHEIADLVARGRVLSRGRNDDGRGDLTCEASSARRIIFEHLRHERVRELNCAGEADALIIDAAGRYTVTIDPLEGNADPDANLPFGTIFSVSECDRFCAAGFIHYGPQTNLVMTLKAGVHVFTLDRAARIYRLVAKDVRVPDVAREFAIDATKRKRWRPQIRTLIDEKLEEADAPGGIPANVRWSGSLTADAYRILRRGGIYFCPMDDQPGRESTCPSLHHAALPVAYIIEQAGGRATTGDGRPAGSPKLTTERTSLMFGSASLVAYVEKLNALPESSFDESPLFSKRSLFRV